MNIVQCIAGKFGGEKAFGKFSLREKFWQMNIRISQKVINCK